MENKPFIFGVATSGDNFTDREKETERLLLNFRHGVNTVLISPRRWGKTSLVQKACRLAQSDKLKIVYIDIFSCRSDRDFYDAFASAILKQTSSKVDEWLISFPYQPQNFNGTGPDDGFLHIARTESQEQRHRRNPTTSRKNSAEKRL